MQIDTREGKKESTSKCLPALPFCQLWTSPNAPGLRVFVVARMLRSPCEPGVLRVGPDGKTQANGVVRCLHQSHFTWSRSQLLEDPTDRYSLHDQPTCSGHPHGAGEDAIYAGMHAVECFVCGLRWALHTHSFTHSPGTSTPVAGDSSRRKHSVHHTLMQKGSRVFPSFSSPGAGSEAPAKFRA